VRHARTLVWIPRRGLGAARLAGRQKGTRLVAPAPLFDTKACTERGANVPHTARLGPASASTAAPFMVERPTARSGRALESAWWEKPPTRTSIMAGARREGGGDPSLQRVSGPARCLLERTTKKAPAARRAGQEGRPTARFFGDLKISRPRPSSNQTGDARGPPSPMAPDPTIHRPTVVPGQLWVELGRRQDSSLPGSPW